jgi:hypothetical protein
VAFQKTGVAFQKTGVAFQKTGVAFQKTGVAFQKTGVAYATPCHPCARHWVEVTGEPTVGYMPTVRSPPTREI